MMLYTGTRNTGNHALECVFTGVFNGFKTKGFSLERGIFKTEDSRLENLETFKPLNPKYKFKKHHKSEAAGVDFEDFINDLGALQKTFQNVRTQAINEDVKILAKEVPQLEANLRGKLGNEVLAEGYHSENVLYYALKALQNDNMPIRERIWALSVLKVAHDQLPSGEIEAINTDVKKGPIFRGTLELSLLRGFEQLLIEQSGIIWRKFNPEVQKIESELDDRLKIVEMFVKIKGLFKEHGNPPATKQFVKIHDQIYEESFLNQKAKQNLAKRCMKHMNKESTSDLEILSSYLILENLAKDDDQISEMISQKLNNKIDFKLAYHHSFAWFNHKMGLCNQSHALFNKLSIQIEAEELNSIDSNDHFKVAITPFTDLEAVKLQDFKNLIDLVRTKQDVIYENKKLVLRILHDSSFYFEGAVEFLNGEMRWISVDEENLLLRPKLVILNQETVSICPVCLERFLPEQEVVQLNCDPSHLMHKGCTMGLIVNSKVQPTCPVCRSFMCEPHSLVTSIRPQSSLPTSVDKLPAVSSIGQPGKVHTGWSRYWNWSWR
ncbi:hypothetical protein CROQUDRAFT_133637 [Cronartium quercuum f. sp. fusiforme G11]|uniref:RING-type domain-containing protein n=1 Tax=Cronartium quercuum f. sp. fusiforme G11 TaxID=708437 RepID=A0A9P6TCH3_9BASI|nr:hypothetical protein CROQUDRAFT_133637 [Cronartium quercuum f. sp. fusiforme G11]